MAKTFFGLLVLAIALPLSASAMGKKRSIPQAEVNWIVCENDMAPKGKSRTYVDLTKRILTFVELDTGIVAWYRIENATLDKFNTSFEVSARYFSQNDASPLIMSAGTITLSSTGAKFTENTTWDAQVQKSTRSNNVTFKESYATECEFFRSL